MEELAQKVIGCESRFIIDGDRIHYRIGGYVTGNMDEDCLTEVPLQVDLKQPRSSACENDALSYQKVAKHLFSERRSFHIPNHVVLGEIFKAVDCRLTELLFLCGVYPEKDWVDQKRSLSFSKKIRIAGKLFPQDIVFHTLNRKMADQRNYAEHRFEEPKDQAVQEALETMNAFIKMTAGLFCILEEFSMFKFQVDEQSEAVVIQIMREQGTLLLLEDGEDPANLFGMPAQSELGQGIIKKVLGDIEWYLQYDPKFMTRLGFL